MHCVHMIVDVLTVAEGCQTDPAEVRVAAGASHVVATRNALDRCLATRASLHVMALCPLLEEISVCSISIWTEGALVILDVTIATDPDQA